MPKTERIQEVVEYLDKIKEEEETPKNLKEKINHIIKTLDDKDIDGAIDKAIHELDDVVENLNMPPYTRTQIWNVVSMLESI